MWFHWVCQMWRRIKNSTVCLALASAVILETGIKRIGLNKHFPGLKKSLASVVPGVDIGSAF